MGYILRIKMLTVHLFYHSMNTHKIQGMNSSSYVHGGVGTSCAFKKSVRIYCTLPTAELNWPTMVYSLGLTALSMLRII